MEVTFVEVSWGKEDQDADKIVWPEIWREKEQQRRGGAVGGSSREVCLLRASQTDRQTRMVNGADNSQSQNLVLEASEPQGQAAQHGTIWYRMTQ